MYWSLTTLFPRVFTNFIYLWSAYVVLTHVTVIPTMLLYILIIPLVLIGIYTYFKVIDTGPGYPTDFPELRVRDLKAAELGTELPPEYLSKRSLTIKHDGRFRVCQTCSYWKPDRTHHCSTCKRCILKMDHHCPWFSECIGFKNQKYFIQFLIYNNIYAFVILGLTSNHLYRWFHNAGFEDEYIDLSLLSVWILALAFAIGVFGFAMFSIYQVCKNRTTIEMYTLRRYRDEIQLLHGVTRELDDYNLFDLGTKMENWKDVMGSRFVEWLLPIPTDAFLKNRNSLDEKGLYFRTNKKLDPSILESADLQDRLLRRVTPRSSVDSSRPLNV